MTGTANPTPMELLQAVAEPTRLRILNCLAAAPLFVADLQEVLELPQPTVSRHLQVLKRADLVRDTPIAPFVLYRLKRGGGTRARMLDSILSALAELEPTRSERRRAKDRSRSEYTSRVSELEAES
jgi:ArsR family transcriptional regulator, arsenate/arsenite/antimonite-responsive transcriptional repressor